MILLIPAPAYRDALLRDGPCAAAPPKAYRCGRGNWLHTGCAILPTTAPRDALVLAWDGQPVPEGVDRAIRVHDRTPFLARPIGVRSSYSLAVALVVARLCVTRGIGEIVTT